jgi:hypothetical protein
MALVEQCPATLTGLYVTAAKGDNETGDCEPDKYQCEEHRIMQSVTMEQACFRLFSIFHANCLC